MAGMTTSPAIIQHPGEAEDTDKDLDFDYIARVGFDAAAQLARGHAVELAYQPGDGRRYPIVLTPLRTVRQTRPRVVRGHPWDNRACQGVVDLSGFTGGGGIAELNAMPYEENAYLLSITEGGDNRAYPIRLGDRGPLAGSYVQEHWQVGAYGGVSLAILLRAISYFLDRDRRRDLVLDAFVLEQLSPLDDWSVQSETDDGIEVKTVAGRWFLPYDGDPVPPASLEELFSSRPRIPELDDEDFGVLRELVEEERVRRQGPATVLVVRHPDCDDDIATEGIIDPLVVYIDLGRSFVGSPTGRDQAREWAESVWQQVRELPADHLARIRVREVIIETVAGVLTEEEAAHLTAA